ncbi:hypothetical protein DNH61_13775 [Paenibacillus sambharensis]|uniref:Cbb3-type cytochrome c oxidase subunit I n=1 Tax=Paenibacillus sambharensis TaxID=1803190 RepID=A0A2W1LUY2_9BACL|nr:hypothetical protein [Paenibacillus sambharensis]PZD95591.1 hypothetical protein DNH61_13775 [Paenibacillus sambharensis]
MFRLPFAFILTGMISFVLFHLLTFADFAGWAAAEPRSPDGWFQAHLIVLGWATMIAMGAVYQLINVILQTKLYSIRLGYVHYVLFTAGATGLLAGFKLLDTQWIAAFATLAFAGIMLFVFNLAATLWKAGQWNAITVSTACAAAYLALTALSGMLMGLNFRFNFLGGMHEALFGTHIWLGTVGWFGMLITGFSYKLLPMFYLAHDYPQKLQAWIVLTWNAAVLAGAAGFLGGWLPVKVLAAGLLAAALVLYNVHISQIAQKRFKRDPGAGIAWAVWASRMLMLACAAAAGLMAAFPELMGRPTLVVFALWLYLYGWVGITIMGYLSKIVPFLWWTHKYGPLAGKQQVPTMGQLLAEKPVHTGLAAVILCMAVLLLGIGTGTESVTMIGGSVLSLAAAGYMAMVAQVFTR